MQSHSSDLEDDAQHPVSVLPTDTLFYALQVMQTHGQRLLPVLDAERALVGLLTEAHLLEAWRADPLAQVREVMAQHPAPREPWLPGEGPETRVLTAAQALDGTEVGEEGFWTTH